MNYSMADTIKPRSDQLNAEDLLSGPITVKITGINRGPADQPVHLLIDGYQPYKPCLTMRRMLVVAWGDDGKQWIGRSLKLYRDPNIKWGKQKAGGIRISNASHIDGPVTEMLAVTRGKRAEFTLLPLDVPDDKPALDENTLLWISQAKADRSVLDTIEDPEYRKLIENNM